MKVLLFFLIIVLVLSVLDARKHKGIKKIKVHKIKTHKIKAPKIHLKHTHVHHVHHAGLHHHTKHHKKPNGPKVIQSTTPVPLYSPPFIGTDTGQIPTDSQVDLIIDWLSKVGATIDVFLRLKDTFPDESTEQRQMIKNVYPPLRILLEAQNAHEFREQA